MAYNQNLKIDSIMGIDYSARLFGIVFSDIRLEFLERHTNNNSTIKNHGSLETLSIFVLLNQGIAYLTTNYVQPIHEVISVSRNRTIGSSKQNTDCPNKCQTFFPFSLLVYLCAKLKNDKPNDGMTNGFPYKMHIEAKLDYCNYLITI